MAWLLILILIAAACYLWVQHQSLLRRVEDLEEALEHGRRDLTNSNNESRSPAEFNPPAPARPTVEEAAREPSAKVVARRAIPEQITARMSSIRPVAADGPAAPRRPRLDLDFEEIFGRRLPIWAGGITLAVAGVFLVRYSIEAGLLTPVVRVVLSFLFGLLLLAAAELAYRFEHRVADERVRQALAGAGLATLYAGFYLAGSQYGLIGQTVAFIGLAAVTALAITLSYRFGLPSAVLGLIGGFAAPALVGGDDANLPLLTLYLALVTAGLTLTGNRQQRPWLGLSALIGGLGWGALLLAAGEFTTGDLLALGLYFVALGAVLPAILSNEGFEQPMRLGAAAIASLQLAFLVESGGFSMLGWGLYALLGAALAWFGWSRPSLRIASAMAAAVAIILLSFWAGAPPIEFALVASALVCIFALVPLLHIWRADDRLVDRLMVAAVPLAVGIVTLYLFDTLYPDATRPWEAAALMLLAGIPALAASKGWHSDENAQLPLQLASAAVLAFLSTACVLHWSAAPFAAAGIALGLLHLLHDRASNDDRSATLLRIGALATAIMVPATDGDLHEMGALVSGTASPDILAAARWLAGAAPAAALAWLERERWHRAVAEFGAAIMLFAALAQLLMPVALLWCAAVLVIGLRWKLPNRDMAILGLTACMFGWAALPILAWLVGTVSAAGGKPLLLPDLPTIRSTLGYLLPFAIALAAGSMGIESKRARPAPQWTAALAVAVIAAHILYRHIFAIDTMTDFIDRGLAERTVWEALLLAAAWLFAKGVGPLKPNIRAAAMLAGLSVAHFAWFTGILHNPLWAAQAVGSIPLANLALACTGVALGGLLSLRIWMPQWRRWIDAMVMIVALLGAISLLRQLFAGTILANTSIGQTEDLLRSLIGIILAAAFLLVGSHRGERSWRVGSLVLMIATVVKVFLFDTAGLEGLLRIASFVALGASLIGIGWFYSRQLRSPEASKENVQSQ